MYDLFFMCPYAEMIKKKIADHEQQPRTTKELGERAREWTVCDQLSSGYLVRMGDLRQVAEYQKQWLKIEKQLGDIDQEGLTYGNLGDLLKNLGDFIQTRAYEWHHGLSILKEVMQSDGEGYTNGNLGITHQRIVELKQAIEHQKHRLSIVEELGKKAEKRTACGKIGNDHQRPGDFVIKKATEYHRRVLSLIKDVGEWAGEGAANGNPDNAYQSLCHFKQAIEHFKKRLSMEKELLQRDEEGAVYGDIGIAYRRLGNFKQAIEYHKQYLRIAKELGKQYTALQRVACGNLGNDYLCLGDFKQAIEYFKQDLSIAQELGERDGEGSAYGNLGTAYYELGDFEEAVECFKQFLDIAKELGKRDEEGCAYGNLGNTYRSLGDFKKAVEYQVKNLKIAKELGQRHAEGSAYNKIGDDYHCLGDLNEAIFYQMKALCIAEELGQKGIEADVCYSLGCIFESVGALHEALDFYRSSVKLCNDLRALVQPEDILKITFRNACHYAYTALWRTLVSLQKIEEALYVAEQGRAQALSDLMKLQYYSESPESIEAKDTIPNLSAGLFMHCPTVFMALESNTIYLWIIKGTETYFQKKTIEDATLLIQKALKEIGVGVHIKCENRSLDWPDRNETLTDDSCHEITDFQNSSLRLLFDSVISPIENKLEGDELIIVLQGQRVFILYFTFSALETLRCSLILVDIEIQKLWSFDLFCNCDPKVRNCCYTKACITRTRRKTSTSSWRHPGRHARRTSERLTGLAEKIIYKQQ